MRKSEAQRQEAICPRSPSTWLTAGSLALPPFPQGEAGQSRGSQRAQPKNDTSGPGATSVQWCPRWWVQAERRAAAASPQRERGGACGVASLQFLFPALRCTQLCLWSKGPPIPPPSPTPHCPVPRVCPRSAGYQGWGFANAFFFSFLQSTEDTPSFLEL